MGAIKRSRTFPSSKYFRNRIMRREENLETRFNRHFIPEPNSGCWLWLGATIKSDAAEYGVMGRSATKRRQLGGSNDLAHRVSYVLHKGEISAGCQIDHTCENTLCVNPEHLQELVSADHIRLTHFRRYGNQCRHGHEYTPQNTWIEKNGIRHCKKCHAEREAQRRADRRNK